MLALATLHDRPTRRVAMIDGRTLGVASAVLTCGQATVFLVPPELAEAFETARGAIRGRVDYPLTLSVRPDGHLTLHAVDTDAVLIDAGRSAYAVDITGIDIPAEAAAFARAA